jgi:hypothetical protein
MKTPRSRQLTESEDDVGFLAGRTEFSHAAPFGKFGLAMTKSTEFNDPSSSMFAPMVVCDSDRTARARVNAGGGMDMKEVNGDKTG